MTNNTIKWLPLAVLATAIALSTPTAQAVDAGKKTDAAPTLGEAVGEVLKDPKAIIDKNKDLEGVPALPDPEKVPGGRAGLVFWIAFAINRLLWLLKKFRGVFPEKAQPYLPFAAAVLGLAYGILEGVLYGTGWITAILTGLAGAAGAVAWREGTRAFDHVRTPKDPPPPPKDPDEMSDDELSGAAS